MDYFNFSSTPRKIAVIKGRLPPDDPLLGLVAVLEAAHAARAESSPAPRPLDLAGHPGLKRLPIHNKMLVTEGHAEFRALMKMGVPPIDELLPWHKVRVAETYIALKTCKKDSIDRARKKLANTVQLLCELLIWIQAGCNRDDPQYSEWISQGAVDQHQLPQDFRMAPEFASLVSNTNIYDSDPESANPPPTPPATPTRVVDSSTFSNLVSSARGFLSVPEITEM
ncbi:hypothetical protein Q9L58_005506 [Maublancomyces gigas]|uniref:Uncharacterized protein n=1 Tax=Discina gigas TaxID=1032678 RepID=A0ABR3GIF5_9PEZI